MIARAALLAAALALAPPAVAAANLRAELEQIAALDTQVQTAGWRLARGNAAYCREVAPAIGLQLFDAASYSNSDAVREALGLAGDIGIAAVAREGPAARAGLAALTALNAVAGQSTRDLPAAKAADYARLAALHDRIDSALLLTGRATFALANGSLRQVAGEPACVTRFEMLTKGSRAAADGKRVVIGRKLVEELSEELLAAALAHELAHNLLGHRERLNAQGRSWGKVKATEREADRLMPWLLANAGYDPSAAVRFFAAWGPKHDLGLFATPDHDGWKSRVKRVTAEIQAMRTAQARRGGAADWAKDFRRSS